MVNSTITILDLILLRTFLYYLTSLFILLAVDTIIAFCECESFIIQAYSSCGSLKCIWRRRIAQT